MKLASFNKRVEEERFFRVFGRVKSLRADAVRQPDATADHAMMTDDGIATQDGGPGVNRDVVFEIRMTLVGLAAFEFAVLVTSQGIPRHQADTLVQDAMLADA